MKGVGQNNKNFYLPSKTAFWRALTFTPGSHFLSSQCKANES